MLDKPHITICRALQLRDTAKQILAAKGDLIMSPDGLFYRRYVDGEIKIELQLPIRGASMPFWLDIWRGDVKVFQIIWFAWHGDGHTEVLIDKLDGELEAALQAVVTHRARQRESCP
jgi:hypothetical protein